MNLMKIAILHYGNSIIDFNKLFGMQLMQINTLSKLIDQKNIEATLFAKKVIGNHKHIKYIKEIPYETFDKLFYDMPFYTRFIDKNGDADIYQGNATPLLALFKSEKTLIRINGHFDFPFSKDDIAREAYNKAHYFFVSEYMKNEYQKKYSFFEEDRCYVLHNAVNQQILSHSKQNQKTKLLFCSRWIAEKGFFVLLRSIEILEKKRDDFEIIIAGGVHSRNTKNERNNNYEKKIIERTKNMRSVRNVGYIPQQKLLELFSNEVDIHLFPSLWGEPFSSIPLEAGMAAVPTIAFDYGSLNEVISHNINGILIKKSKYEYINVRRLANAIETLLDDKDFSQQLGQASRKNIVKNFTWEKHIKKLLSIYEKIISNNL